MLCNTANYAKQPKHMCACNLWSCGGQRNGRGVCLDRLCISQHTHTPALWRKLVSRGESGASANATSMFSGLSVWLFEFIDAGIVFGLKRGCYYCLSELHAGGNIYTHLAK